MAGGEKGKCPRFPLRFPRVREKGKRPRFLPMFLYATIYL